MFTVVSEERSAHQNAMLGHSSGKKITAGLSAPGAALCYQPPKQAQNKLSPPDPFNGQKKSGEHAVRPNPLVSCGTREVNYFAPAPAPAKLSSDDVDTLVSVPISIPPVCAQMSVGQSETQTIDSSFLAAELIRKLLDNPDDADIYHVLKLFYANQSHNPLVELECGTIAFVHTDSQGSVRVFIGSMHDFCLFAVSEDTFEGALAVEELFEYEHALGQSTVRRQTADEMGSRIAGRKMYPVLEFTSFVSPAQGKATCQVKKQWR